MVIKKKFNEEQKKMLSQDRGVTLLLGDICTGKTTTLIEQMHRLAIKQKNIECEIYFFTTTGRDIEEVHEKLKLVQQQNGNRITISTIYNCVLNILSNETIFLKNKHIYDYSALLDIVAKIMSSKNIDLQLYNKNDILNIIFNLKSAMITPQEYKTRNNILDKKDKFTSVIGTIFEEYENIITKNNIFDNEDVLMLFYNLLLNNNAFYKKICDRFKYVFIDDLQNTTKLQYLILKQICSKYGNMFTAGNDIDSIYTLYCDKNNIKLIQEDYKNCFVVKLVERFGEKNNIMLCASSILGQGDTNSHECHIATKQNIASITKLCSDIDTQEPYTISLSIKLLLKAKKYRLEDVVIICRDEKNIGPLQEAFAKYKIQSKRYSMQTKKQNNVVERKLNSSVTIATIYDMIYNKCKFKCSYIIWLNTKFLNFNNNDFELKINKILLYHAFLVAKNDLYLSYSLNVFCGAQITNAKNHVLIENLNKEYINPNIQTTHILKLYDKNYDLSFYSKINVFEFSFTKKKYEEVF